MNDKIPFDLGSDTNRQHALNIIGNGHFKHYVQLILALDGLYKALSGGDALQVTAADSLEEMTQSETDYEQHTGTPWANEKKVLVPSPFTPNVPRSEVYATLDEYAKPEFREQIKAQLDSRFPLSVWGDSFPVIGACQVLINENLEHLVNK